MKICFYTESNHWSTPPIESCGRTDVNWMFALKAEHCPLTQMPGQKEYDLGIIIVPKKNPQLAFEGFERSRNKCKKWATMQEGNQTFWQNYSINDQVGYLNLLSQMNIIFCHNEIDKRYYRGLISHKNVTTLPSLMIDDVIPTEANKTPQNGRNGVMLGGNFCEWYGGIDSFMIAQEFGENIYIPTMGRKVEGEENIEGLTHLPYMNWQQWMIELNKVKYAVHLMRTYAAGSFQLNCSRLSIPCISYNSLDTARICQPDLSVDEGDLAKARKLAKHLKENRQFYNHCSAVALKNYYDNFDKKTFLDKFYSNFK